VNHTVDPDAFVLTALLFTLTILVLVSATQVIDDQQRVLDARAPVEPETVDPSSASLLTASYDDSWSGVDVHRVVVAGGAEFPDVHPPGIPRNPLPGEVFASDAYLDAMRTNSALAQAVADLDIVGQIGRDGLRDPHEARLIQGISLAATANAPMTTTADFGDDVRETPRVVELTGPLAFFLPLVLIITLMPLSLALVLSTRLMSKETDHRFAILQAMGVRRRTCRALAAAEVLPHAFVGAVAAVVLFELGWRRMTGVPGTQFHFYSEDTAVPAWVAVTVPVTCVLAVVMTSAVAATTRPSPSTRPVRAARAPRWWWLVPTSAAFVMLAVSATVIDSGSERSKQLAVLSAGGLMASLPLLFSVAVSAGSASLARRAGTARVLVGARWAGDRAGAGFKLATAFSLVLFVAFVTVPFAAALDVEPTRGTQGLRAADGFNVYVTNTGTDLSGVASWDGVNAWLPYYEAQAPSGDVFVLLPASCADLTRFSRGTGCREAPQLIDTRGEPSDTDGLPDRMRLLGGDGVVTGPVDGQIYVPLGQTFQSALKVPRLDVDTPPTGYVANLESSGRTRAHLEARLVSVAPTARTSNDYELLVEQSDSLSGYITFVGCGAVAGLLALLIALGAALMRSVRDRRAGVVAVFRLGASAKDQRVASLMALGLPVLVCTAISCASASAFVAALHQIFPGSSMPVSYFVLLALASPAVTVAAVLVCVPMLGARSDNDR
jgi:hypothetical protein